MGEKTAPGPQEQRFAAYIEGLAKAAGHADRNVPLKNYCTGLLLPGDRKSVEPMAARLAPGNVRRMHQSLHHLVADAPWSDEAVLDFTGSDPQLGSSLNVPSGGDPRHTMLLVGVYYVLYTVNPKILLNTGLTRPFTCITPQWSVLNPMHPAAVSCRAPPRLEAR